MLRLFSLISCFCWSCSLLAQYPPAANVPGTSALAADSEQFVNWAQTCTINRGWQDISDPSLGLVDFGTEAAGIGPAGSNGVVSLGDGGSAILTFDPPIVDGPGWDFAVFENGFEFGQDQVYLELAFVEVSSDGTHFFRFPAHSLTDTSQQVDAFGGLLAQELNNLAGKYRALFGTPFDLAEMANQPLLDLQQITHVRLIDVVGSLDPAYASLDTAGRKINDPFPTPFETGGFDLDAIGVIHQQMPTSLHSIQSTNWQLFPNPLPQGNGLTVHSSSNGPSLEVQIVDSWGRSWGQQTVEPGVSSLSTQQLPSGWYVLHFQSNGRSLFHRKIHIQ
ncbi:MAG: T9SS type A sorting domain-containing protein [Bacteroidota bacterium]